MKSAIGLLPKEGDLDLSGLTLASENIKELMSVNVAEWKNEIPDYVRAIYMTGSKKIETSADVRKYELHKDLLDPEGNPVLQENHNYITIRGYYNGPDQWAAENRDALYTPVDLSKAIEKGIIDENLSVVCTWIQ